MENVYDFLEKLNLQNKTVIAAISGGPDSMFLFDILLSVRKNYNLNIIVAHVHHNLRKESDIEAIKVEEYCKQNNVKFEFYKIDKYPDNKFSEENARKIRYEFFDKLIIKYKTDILFTAHHADDLMETILMRISRGSSLKGYAGIEAISKSRGYIIARPLIYLTKSEIKEYLEKKCIWYAIDKTNTDDNYTRNRYRNHIIPKLKEENKDIHYKFIEFSEKLLMANSYIRQKAQESYLDIINDNYIDILKFNKLEEIIKINVLEIYFDKIFGSNIVKLSSKHVNMVIDFINKNKSNTISLPDNMYGIIEYNKFKIFKSQATSGYDIEFVDSVVLPNGKKIYVDNNTLETSNYVIHLNSNEIEYPLHVRNVKNGDKMTIKNFIGTKKVNDIFTDEKISKIDRCNYPLVCDNSGQIIWIPGIKKSQFDRKKDKKYDIIYKYD